MAPAPALPFLPLQASVRDWKCLKRSLQGLLDICNLCRQQQSGVRMLDVMGACASERLAALLSLLDRLFDVEASEQCGRFTVPAGLDPELDEKRLLHNGLPDLLAREDEAEIKATDYLSWELAE